MGMWFCLMTYYDRNRSKVSITGKIPIIQDKESNIMYEHFVNQLKNRLKAPLPGEERQFLMAPVSRVRIKDIPYESYNPKKSAVLILLFPLNNVLKTVLIQRPDYEGIHSGQIAFPGGKYEETDLELSNTALRETFEEIGVKQDEIKILGSLTDLYINPSNFLVTPFVGYMDKIPSFIPNEREVKKIIVVDLDTLNDISIQGVKTIQHSNGIKIKTPYYEVEGLTVWGATAMIISELNAVVTESKIIF
jgi:8-oxo-dGTP pyrophosphatase MutT (NUDIX family)